MNSTAQMGDDRPAYEAQPARIIRTECVLHDFAFYETVARISFNLLKSAGLVKW